MHVQTPKKSKKYCSITAMLHKCRLTLLLFIVPSTACYGVSIEVKYVAAIVQVSRSDFHTFLNKPSTRIIYMYLRNLTRHFLLINGRQKSVNSATTFVIYASSSRKINISLMWFLRMVLVMKWCLPIPVGR